MTEILIVLLLVLANGFFALSELAVLTARRARLKQMAVTSRGAREAIELAEHPERFLSAVQVWITLLGLLTGKLGADTLAPRLEKSLLAMDLAWLTQYAYVGAFVVSFALITFVQVVLGELLPKRLATLRPERIAAAVAIPMAVLATLAKPAVLLLSGTTRLLLRALGLSNVGEEKVTEEEIRHLVAESHEQGVIDSDERNMLNRVLRLGDRNADSLMTPRTRITWLDTEATLEQNLETMRATPFSRYPVYRGSDSDVLGILEAKYLAGLEGLTGNEALVEHLRPALFVSEATNALKLLEIFREEQQTIALVVDEYGDIQGVVTVNDLLGAVLGRVQSAPSEEDGPLVVEREDGSWLLDGRLAADDLRELLGSGQLPGEADNDFTTVAGMVIARFGRIPHAGEHFDWQGWRIEVVDLDGARIDKLLVARIDRGGDAEPGA
jgi:putative hemolysin